MDARTGRRQKRLSNKQEKRTAQDINGRVQANSGATRMGGGGDVRGSGMRLECKYTEKDTFSLKHSELEKLRKQANKTLEEPVFQFGFKNPYEMQMYAVIPWNRVVDGSGGIADEIYDLDTAARSVSIGKGFARARAAEGARIRVTFREGAFGRQYEVMTWSDFLEERGMNA